MKVELPELGYEYNALEPYIDAQTMEIHHSKHHQGYTNKYNVAIEGKNIDMTPEELLSNPEMIPEDIKGAVVNNGGGYVNHKLFWQILKKDVVFEGDIKTAIESTFGSFDAFKDEFSKAAATQFGSGWAWLVVDASKNLKVISTPNQDSPLMQGLIPILGLDVWEHAYYLKYQNKRPEYIEAFFNIINWDKVNELYKEATK